MNNTIKWSMEIINNYGIKISLIWRPMYLVCMCPPVRKNGCSRLSGG